MIYFSLAEPRGVDIGKNMRQDRDESEDSRAVDDVPMQFFSFG